MSWPFGKHGTSTKVRQEFTISYSSPNHLCSYSVAPFLVTQQRAQKVARDNREFRGDPCRKEEDLRRNRWNRHTRPTAGVDSPVDESDLVASTTGSRGLYCDKRLLSSLSFSLSSSEHHFKTLSLPPTGRRQEPGGVEVETFRVVL